MGRNKAKQKHPRIKKMRVECKQEDLPKKSAILYVVLHFKAENQRQ